MITQSRFNFNPDKAEVGYFFYEKAGVGAIFLILLFSPVLLIVALLVKLSSSGPVICSQERAGLNGRPHQRGEKYLPCQRRWLSMKPGIR